MSIPVSIPDAQLAFDIEGILHQAAVEAAPPWAGAPLHFTTAYYSPAELGAAFAHWQFLHSHDDTHVQSRMWHQAIAAPSGFNLGDHSFGLFTADLRCEPWKHSEPQGDCLCVGDLVYQSTCAPCGWHAIAPDENSAVEHWHDHALSGLRDLPVVPARLRKTDSIGLSKAARRWIEEHYPNSIQIAGAPIITERSGTGTRHVPGRSPWCGYDLSHTALERDATAPRARRHPMENVLASTRPSCASGRSIGD